MFQDHTIAVVVPAFNEAEAIYATVTGMPAWIDLVIVVDDASRDATAVCAREAGEARGGTVEVVQLERNQGVGAAIVTGYRKALDAGCDFVVVMAGDGQMDPSDLPSLLAPLVAGQADYAKGNRFLHPDVWREMPKSRIVGNVGLSLATKLVSGYGHVFDSQCGYTAITAAALLALPLDALYPRYGYPNDLLARLHATGQRVVDVPVRPVYGQKWKSGISLKTAVHPIPWVLMRALGTRLYAEWRR